MSSNNRFLSTLNKKDHTDSESVSASSSNNRFLVDLQRSNSKSSTTSQEKSLPWTKGLGIESLYRFPGLALQGAGAAISGEPGDIASGMNAIGGLLTRERDNEQKFKESLIGKLPTSNELLKSSALQPQNRPEEIIQNLSHDTMKLFLPGRYMKAFGRGANYAKSALRSLSLAAGANLAGQGTESYTGSKRKGDIARQGSMFLLSFANPKSAMDIASQTRGKAEALLDPNAKISGHNFEAFLNNMTHRITKGRSYDQLSPSEKWIMDRINNYRPIVQNGEMNVSQLVAQRTSTNEHMNEIYNFSRNERNRAKKLLGNLQYEAKKEMESYGHHNPQWWDLQKSSDEAYHAIHQSNVVNRLIQPLLKGKGNSAVAHIFGGTAASAISGISAPAAGLATGAYQGTKYMYRITHSPLLARHYGKVVAAALSGDTAQLESALNTLEKGLKRDEKKRIPKSPDTAAKERKKELVGIQ